MTADGVNELATILYRLSERVSPPSWVLIEPFLFVDDLAAYFASNFGEFPITEPASGAMELPHGPQEINIHEVLSALDPGREVDEKRTMKSGVTTWWRTKVNGIPVIGPGGRISSQQFRSRNRISLLVRRRGGHLATQWRSMEEVLGRVSGYLDRWRGTPVQIEIGYYEAGKNSTQTSLEFCLLVVVDNDDSQDEGPWRAVVVEPLVERIVVPVKYYRTEMNLLEPPTIPYFNGVVDQIE